MSQEHEHRFIALENNQQRLEQSHVGAMNAMRDVTKGLTELTAEMRLTNERREHMATDVKRIEENQKDLGKRVNAIEKNQESFRPYVNLMEKINTRMWFVMIGVIGAVVMLSYNLSASVG